MAEPVSRDQISGANRYREIFIFPVHQLTTSRIGNLTRLIYTPLYMMTINTYTYVAMNITCSRYEKIFSMCVCLKKIQNAPRPSEHPPVRGGGMSKRLGGIKGCKYKTSSWHLNGFPDPNNIGSTVKCRGDAHRYTVHLH